MNLFTIPEIALLVGKSRQWIWQLIKQGRLKAKRVGGVFILREDDLPNDFKQHLPSQPNTSYPENKND